MHDILPRIWENLLGRADGPMSFRFILQPLMATLFALRDGRKDARAGKPPWLWAVANNAQHRSELLHDGWRSVGKIFILAIVLDAIYQAKVFHFQHFYPGEAIIVACLLALVPYAVLRGPANRILRGAKKTEAPAR